MRTNVQALLFACRVSAEASRWRGVMNVQAPPVRVEYRLFGE